MNRYLLIATVLALAACDRPPPEETVFDEKLETMERARAVEGQLQQRADEIDEKLKEREDPPQ
ncbi:MAG: hypothetical protein KJO55_08165 [Gammaproteobacteria bacterium]|nr:hypothetical protein [Gammaproteobacteria bacterium]NND59749.1 hypothetical protein [Gammaproteobacteria bacterium]